MLTENIFQYIEKCMFWKGNNRLKSILVFCKFGQMVKNCDWLNARKQIIENFEEKKIS